MRRCICCMSNNRGDKNDDHRRKKIHFPVNVQISNEFTFSLREKVISVENKPNKHMDIAKCIGFMAD